MRVLQVINSIAPARGGPTYVVLRLARALADRGVGVEVISTRADLDAAAEAEARRLLGADIPLTLVRVAGPARVELAPGWLAALAPRVRRADVVHIHTVWTYPVAVTPVCCRWLRVPYIIRPAGTLDAACIASRSERKKRLALELVCRRNLEKAAAVQVTSEHERRELAQLVPAARLELVEVGVDLALSSTVSPDAGGVGRRIGFLGRLHPKKGIEALLGALARLPGAQLELAGAGEPAYEAELRARAEALGVAGRTRWLGHLGETDKRDFLARVDLLAFPSKDENFGVAVAEAMAAGRAVVVSPGVALSEDVARYRAGEVSPAEPAGLAAAISRLLENGSARAEAGGHGRDLAQTRWSWARIADRTEALYTRAGVDSTAHPLYRSG